jgi:ABC-2 type transport system permease protein
MTSTAQASAGASTTTGQARSALPGVWRIGLSRGAVELRAFFRAGQSVVFILAMPAVMLVLLGAIFSRQHQSAPAISVSDLYVAGLIGGGVMATSYQNLGMSIAVERERFTLKRLRGTPMPAAAYFIGKIIQVLVAALAEVAILLAIGVAFYHLRLPTTVSAWWTFTWVFGLGAAACSLLGIAASSVPRSAARNGIAVITLPFVVLQFISGVYVPIFLVPRWLRDVATVFPLEWMCRGMRSVFVPQAVVLEPGHSWQLGQTALVLGASILMLIQAAQADLGGSRPQAAGHLDLAVRTARENLAGARVLVADLIPGQLAGSTLAAALGRLSRSPGVDATFNLSGAPRALPVAAEVVLLRVCQEALANVRKHARARSASVRLGYRPDAVILEVSDDGVGFDPGRVGGGFGLSGMRTRVTEAGGMLTVSSSPGGGTSVRATVPG